MLITFWENPNLKKKKNHVILLLIHINERLVKLNPKRAGLFWPISQPEGGGFCPPLRSRKPIDETSSVWYYWIAMTLPSPLVPKKFRTYLVWRHSDIISDVMSKTRKSPKIAKIMVFRYFFKQKLHFLAMMCIKVCLHMFLLQINQINKINIVEVYPERQKRQKTRFVCNFNGKLVFSLCPARYYATPHHNPRSDFYKNGLKSSARLEEKSHEVSARKNNNRQRYNKKCWRGQILPPPALLGLIYWICQLCQVQRSIYIVDNKQILHFGGRRQSKKCSPI